MSDDLETRRRRAVWRATHRGTKELDLLVGAYAKSTLATMPESELAHFEKFLALPDPEIQDWLLAPERSAASASEFADLVAVVRKFHGLV
jgi:antitoxin CptB